METNTKTRNKAEQYFSDVLSGRLLTSKMVRLAVERHYNDLEHGHERGLRFNRKRAGRMIQFIEAFCRHSQGEWAGNPFILSPWQAAKFWILNGWEKDNGYRRFRYAYSEEAKGNGKSCEASGVGLYELIGSGEPGSEVYSVATKKDQARIVFAEAERMVAQSPDLKKRIKNYRDSLFIPGTASKFQPLSSDEDSLDGPRPQCIIVDELHAWGASGRKLWDVLANALGKRRSPLFYVITTAGSDRNSICWQQHEYVEKVLQGLIEDDNWFGWIAGLDEGDDWEDERNWLKSNPNLGVSVQIDELRAVIGKAKNDPASLNGVLRLRLGVWTQSHTQWMPVDEWRECAGKVNALELRRRPCFAGLDLSSVTDTTAFVLLFPPIGDEQVPWRVLPFFFLPKENIQKRVKQDRVPYDTWERMGLFELTPGRTVDYGYLRTKINQLGRLFDIREIVYDRWNADALVTNLEEDGFEMVKLGQGYESMNAPMRYLMTLVRNRELAHGANPVLAWQASNVMAAVDPAGFIKPDKAASRERIDGMAALIDALARAMLVPVQNETFKPFVL